MRTSVARQPKSRQPRDRVDVARANWMELYPDIDTSHLEIFSRMRLIVHGLELSMDEVLARYSLTRADFNIISQLVRNRRAMTPSEFAQGANISGAGVTKRLDRLESRGMITRRTNPQDGRGFLVELTPKIPKSFRTILAVYSEAERAFLAGLTPKQVGELEKSLRVLVRRIEEAHPNVRSTAPSK